MKRFLDFLFALAGVVFLFPLYCFLAISVAIKLGKPVLFTQIRPGLYEKPFKIFKFRTMTNEMDDRGDLLPNAQRLTKFGSFLRSTSLDELPELFNVLKGDMSLVGPRPLLMDYLPLYNDFQKRRMEVKPGITGWTQVNGRNALSWNEKFKFDMWYVENRNPLLDFKIMLLTLKKVLKREGITHEDDVAMPRFTGNKTN